MGGCFSAGGDARESFLRSRQVVSSSESMRLRRRFGRERASSGSTDAEVDASSGSDSRMGVGAWRLAPVTVGEDRGEGTSASRRLSGDGEEGGELSGDEAG
jgi:hypothetical protein